MLIFNKYFAFFSGREELLFFQLPDTLPVLPKSKEDEKPKVKQEPGIGFGHGHGPESTVPDGSLSQPGNSDEVIVFSLS